MTPHDNTARPGLMLTESIGGPPEVTGYLHPWSWAWCWWPYRLRRHGVRRITLREIVPFLDFYEQWGVLF